VIFQLVAESFIFVGVRIENFDRFRSRHIKVGRLYEVSNDGEAIFPLENIALEEEFSFPCLHPQNSVILMNRKLSTPPLAKQNPLIATIGDNDPSYGDTIELILKINGDRLSSIPCSIDSAVLIPFNRN